MPGFLRPKAAEVVYQQEFSWLRSPEVWGTLVKVFVFGVVAGAILAMYAGCSDLAKDAKSQVPCKPVPTVPSSPKS